MRRRRRGEPGRLKIRLAELIQAEGFEISEYDIDDTKGWYRSSRYSESYRWTGRGPLKDTDSKLWNHFASWDTMTNCVKYGISIQIAIDELPLHYEVWANPANP